VHQSHHMRASQRPPNHTRSLLTNRTNNNAHYHLPSSCRLSRDEGDDCSELRDDGRPLSSCSNDDNDDSSELELTSSLYMVAVNSDGVDRPKHWPVAEGDAVKVKDGRSPLDVMWLMGCGDNKRGDDGNKGASQFAAAERQGSNSLPEIVFYDPERQGISLGHSARASARSEEDSTRSSKLWDCTEDCSRHSKITEVSPPTENKRKKHKRRKLFARRCDKAVVGFEALVALGGSVEYFVFETCYELVFEFLFENNFFGRMFGNDNDCRAEQKDDGPICHGLPEALEDNLVDDGGSARISRSEEDLQVNGHSSKHRSLLHHKRGERAERVLAREQRIQSQQEISGEMEFTAHRKTMDQADQGQCHDQVLQDHHIVGQGRHLDTEGWENLPHQESSHQYGRHRLGEEDRREQEDMH